MVLDIGMSELVSNEVAIVHERGSQDGYGRPQVEASWAEPGDAGGVVPIPLSEGRGPRGSELRVSRDTDSSLRTDGAVAPGRGDGSVTTPTSSGRSRSRRGRGMRHRASVTSRTSDEVSNVTSSEAPRDYSEQLYTLVNGVTGEVDDDISLDSLPAVNALLELDEMSIAEFGEALKAGDLGEVVALRPEEELNSSSVVDEAEYTDVVSKNPPMGLPPDRGVRHEIDLVPGTKYCVTRQRPLPNEQCDVIDVFFRAMHEAGGEHSERDSLGVAGDAPGLSNAPATFKRLVTQLFRPHRAYAQTYFGDIFVHSRAEHGKSDLENHVEHLRAVLECMRTNKLYGNLDKCVFGAEEIPFRGCFIGKQGLRADPAKVKTIVEWQVPKNRKDLRKWLGLANYLHKYSANYAEMARPLSNLLKKDALWCWEVGHAEACQAVKASLLRAPILALPDPDRPFSVVCDASDFAIGCALLQADAEGRERVIAFESRQLKAAEKNYPVHDKELLAMKYALVKFRVYLLGSKPFVIYTDHASLRTTTQSPHLSQRMARWLSFFAEYNFEVKYKPGRLNVVADALSRRLNYELAHVKTVTSSVLDLIRIAYAHDDMCVSMLRALGSEEFKNSDKELSRRLRASLHRYTLDGGLLYYSTDPEDAPRGVVPHDEDLKYRILYEVHGTPVDGHLGREKTYGSVSTMYWWPKLYKWVGTYVRTCETCQRTKSSPHTAAPLASLPVPTGCWQSISMDFVFGLPKDKAGNTGIVVFVDRLSKKAHLAAVPDTIDGEGTALLFLDRVFRQHGLPEAIVSDRDPRFSAKFWKSLFHVLGTRLDMFTADQPQTDGQTERVNRVLEDILRSVCAEAPRRWSEVLPLVEFALNNAVHASTGFTPFYVNGLANPRIPLTPPRRGSGLSGGGIAARLADISPVAVRKQVDNFVSLRLSVMRQVRDAMAESQDLQKEYADVQGRGNVERFEVGDLVLLNAKILPTYAVSAVFKTKLSSRFIGQFKFVAKKGLAYTLNLPKKMRTHPVFYVGLLKPYQDPAQVSVEALAPGRQEATEPQAAGRQRVAEPQDAERMAEGAATDQADPAAEQPDAQGRRPGSEGHSAFAS
ncbi:hypothetical protein PC122_g23379 [Phytophthora cactorum]|nr:hypothetical protein PC122_g23379 [Phytophthora cactorum]